MEDFSLGLFEEQYYIIDQSIKEIVENSYKYTKNRTSYYWWIKNSKIEVILITSYPDEMDTDYLTFPLLSIFKPLDILETEIVYE